MADPTDHTHAADEGGARNMAFFDRRVDAILSLLTGQGTDKYRPEIQRRAIEFYNQYEDRKRSSAESWILAIRALAVELGALGDGEISEKLEALRKSLETEAVL